MNKYTEQRATFEEIKEVVENNDKKRYQLSAEVDLSGKEVWWIRAVSGHSIEEVNDEEVLTPILDPFLYEEVVHGTYFDIDQDIMKDGLSKQERKHIRKLISIINHYRYGYWDARKERSHKWHA